MRLSQLLQCHWHEKRINSSRFWDNNSQTTLGTLFIAFWKIFFDGVSMKDGKRAECMSLFPWKNGQILLRDSTWTDTLAPSYVENSTKKAWKNAKDGERKTHYEHLLNEYDFSPISAENFGTWGRTCFAVRERSGKIVGRQNVKKTHKLSFPST